MSYYSHLFAQVLNSSTFSLTRLYPRQELTTDMNMQSMVELKLVPTGVVIVRDNVRMIVWYVLFM